MGGEGKRERERESRERLARQVVQSWTLDATRRKGERSRARQNSVYVTLVKRDKLAVSGAPFLSATVRRSIVENPLARSRLFDDHLARLA